MAYLPAGVPPGGPLPGVGVTIPPPQEVQSAARNSTEQDRTRGSLNRRTLRELINPTQKRIQARSVATLPGPILGSMRNRGETKKPERCVVITTSLALDGLVPSNVTEEGATVQDAPVGMPEQLNVTT